MREVSWKHPALRQKSNPYTVTSAAKDELDFTDMDDDVICEPEIHQLHVTIETKNKDWNRHSHWAERVCDPYWPVSYAVEMYKRTLQWQNENPRTQADWTVELCRRLNGLIFPSFAQDEDDWESARWQLAKVREGRVEIHSRDNRYEVIFTFTSDGQVKLFYIGPVEMARKVNADDDHLRDELRALRRSVFPGKKLAHAQALARGGDGGSPAASGGVQRRPSAVARVGEEPRASPAPTAR